MSSLGSARKLHAPRYHARTTPTDGRATGIKSAGRAEGTSRYDLATALHTVESGIRHETNEHARLVDATTGAVLLEKEGRKTRSGKYEHVIEFTSGEVARMHGAILTHNHPGGESFTDADIELAATHGLREIRAVSASARYSMRPPGPDKHPDGTDSEPKWNRKLWTSTIKPAYERALVEVERENLRDIRAGRITEAEAWDRELHMAWERVARETGLRYKREGWNKPQRTYPRKPKTTT